MDAAADDDSALQNEQSVDDRRDRTREKDHQRNNAVWAQPSGST